MRAGPLHKLSADTWLVGNIAEHIKLGGIFRSHEKYAQEYGPVFAARNVHKPIVMVESPELARKVLLSCQQQRCICMQTLTLGLTVSSVLWCMRCPTRHQGWRRTKDTHCCIVINRHRML